MNFNQELTKLNPQQLAAVVTNDVPLRIIAGAGSGKTRVITMKIAYLIKQEHIRSWRILAMTFTNKAANEMKVRVKNILTSDGSEEINPFISTFHSFCYRVLREEHEAANLPKNFTVIDQTEQKIILKQITQELGLTAKDYPKIENKALYKIETFKNSFESPEDVLSDQTYLTSSEDRLIARIYEAYEKTLAANGYVDFNDLQLKTYLLFEKHSSIAQKWANRFDYILVDEFQDTNALQFELIKILVNKRNNLTVVGDPDQTIYSWRGAQVNIILNFNRVYPNAKTVVLDRNYRSTKQILDLANDAIKHNQNREEKEIYTDVAGQKVMVYEAPTREDEARFVAEKIKDYVKAGVYEYRDFFIIYRINAWSDKFETIFDNFKIPYQLVGGFKFRERKVIKDAIAYLRAAAIHDQLAIDRVLKNTPKIGGVTLSRIHQFAEDNSLTLYEALVDHREEMQLISKHLPQVGDLLREGNGRVQANVGVYETMKFLLTKADFEDRVKILAKSEDDEQYLQVLYDSLLAFDDNFEEENYGEPNHVLAYLQEEALGAEEEDEQLPNRVTLLTIHAAKGLENKVVFLTGVNKGVFPSKRSAFNSEQLEEERRALYVALTRAQKELFITYVSGEWSFIGNEPLTVSKFVKELNQDLYNFESGAISSVAHFNSHFGTDNVPVMVKKDAIESEIQVGDLVEHALMGEGIVIKRIGNQFRIAFTDPSYGVMLIDVTNPALTKK